MEIGNAVFGNSRGEYPVERGVYEQELYRLFDAMGSKSCPEFENKVFSLFPYYCGDCTCGFADHRFTGEHINCYQNEVVEEKLKNGWRVGENNRLVFIVKGLKFGQKEPDTWKLQNTTETKILKSLCEKHNLPFPDGCYSHCTCDYEERYKKWLQEIGYPNECREDCLTEKPNFHYKPVDLKIKWYKYPFRDSYSNIPFTYKEFRKIITQCVKSLKED